MKARWFLALVFSILAIGCSPGTDGGSSSPEEHTPERDFQAPAASVEPQKTTDSDAEPKHPEQWIVAVIILGICAQWIAWRINLPSILLLLLTGIAVGPVGFDIVQPKVLFGDLFYPFVSISVALILYEGGLSLRLKELGPARGVVQNLVSLGLLVNWFLGSLAAYWLFELKPLSAALISAIFVVTGPTVIGPLLRHVRPTGSVGSILKWEGIVTDPIGAMLAVLLFEIVVGDEQHGAYAAAIVGALATLACGIVVGAIGAYFLWQVLRRHLVPDFLQNPFSLMLVLMVFVAGNLMVAEAGLMGVTLMGIMLANQRSTPVGHIIEFKENLRVLLISTLFILLAALVTRADIDSLDWRHFTFLGVLIFVIRPATVLISTMRSKLDWREKVFVSSVAPRGIVAAAVSSVIAIELGQRGHAEEGGLLVPLTFLVIMGTVTIYGLGAAPVARWLGLSEVARQGFLILGAHAWARAMAKTIMEQGLPVLLVDSNRRNVSQARLDGLSVYHGNLLDESTLDEIDLSGLGQFLALTSNDEINTLACLHLEDVFGRTSVYQLISEDLAGDEVPTRGMGGRNLFTAGITYSSLELLFRHRGTFKATSLTAEFDLESYHVHHGDEAVPLFVVSEPGKVRPFTAEAKSSAKPGETLISMVSES